MIHASSATKPQTLKAASRAPLGKRQLLCISGLVLAISSFGAYAQSVWTYEVIGSDNRATVSGKPPKDISYPPANQPVPIYNPNEKREIPMTAEEVAARRRAPMLVIVLGPAIP